MLITYSRPQDLDPQQLDAAAPAADLDPIGYECEAETVDVNGTPWSCTRRRAHTDDEHRAVFGQLGDGPAKPSQSPGRTSTEGPVTVRPLPSPCTPSP